jgi:hypothetical protein
MNDAAYIRAIILAWEKRRLLYNLLLLPVGLALTVLLYSEMRVWLTEWELLANAFFVALLANGFYFIAPLSEIYTWALLGWQWTPTQRNLLFVAGLVFSALALAAAAFAVAFSVALSNQ